nr:PREDICTED: trans-cinnamate 4-monooxygenase-like [Musa acuminata subsp. malaccensis]
MAKLAVITLVAVASAYAAKSFFPDLSPFFLSLPLLLLLPFALFSGSGSDTPPGPVSFPIVGNWLQVGNDLNHRNLVDMAKKYGNVFLLRLGARNLVVVSDPKLATEVLHTQGVEFGSRPRNVVWDIFTDNGKDMVFTEYGDHWRKMRRIMTLPFFTNKVVQQYREMWEEEMDRPFLRGYLNKCRDLQRRRLAFYNDNYVEKRRILMAARDGKRLRCAMDYILEAEMNGEITSDNVIYIVENINVAAIETTLWSMEWAIAELVNHPNVQQRLRKELWDVLGDEPLTETNLQRLPYLQAVAKETLRLHSPIPLLVPHMNLEEAKLGGYDIPKRTKVIVNAWWLGNNPEWWHKPEEFRPERFLDEEKEVEALVGGKVDFRFLPFGVGRRSCPGIIVALPLLSLIVGKLVKDFEMVTPPGVDKIDVTEKGGQFSLQIVNHSTIAFHPIAP